MPQITKRLVESAEVRDKDYIIFDSEIPGFGARILPSGKRSYLVQYRIGRKFRRAIGNYADSIVSKRLAGGAASASFQGVRRSLRRRPFRLERLDQHLVEPELLGFPEILESDDHAVPAPPRRFHIGPEEPIPNRKTETIIAIGFGGVGAVVDRCVSGVTTTVRNIPSSAFGKRTLP